MDGFDPRTSFGDEESRRYDATDTRGDEPETVAFLARLAAGRDALEAGRYDPVTQVLDQTYIHIGPDGIDLRPLSLRLAFPPEFDLMARLAGLRLRDRWGGWTGEPFTSASWRHVSVYEHS